MRKPINLPPRFLTTPEAGRFLDLSGRTLEKHRTFGTGPRYRKIGGRIIYAIDDLQKWADESIRYSTDEPHGDLIVSTAASEPPWPESLRGSGQPSDSIEAFPTARHRNRNHEKLYRAAGAAGPHGTGPHRDRTPPRHRGTTDRQPRRTHDGDQPAQSRQGRHRRCNSMWTLADERIYQGNLAAIRFERRGEIDALSRKLARQAGAIAAFRVRCRINEPMREAAS